LTLDFILVSEAIYVLHDPAPGLSEAGRRFLDVLEMLRGGSGAQGLCVGFEVQVVVAAERRMDKDPSSRAGDFRRSEI